MKERAWVGADSYDFRKPGRHDDGKRTSEAYSHVVYLLE